jgi:starch synthase
MPDPISVLFTASEADPFIKVGGLGDVAGSLPKAILNLKSGSRTIDIRLVIPYHTGINLPEVRVKHVADFSVPYKHELIPVQVFSTLLEGLKVYLISSEWISASDRVYDLDLSHSAKKYLLFSKAVAMLPAIIDWKVDILHANDWHTALSIPFIQTLTSNPQKTVISIHNLPFMGSEARGMLGDFHLQPSNDTRLPEWARELPLPIASSAADQVLTVSPTYAREIMTPQFGCDLDPFYLSIQEKVAGILNGIDLEVWNPAADSLLPAAFNLLNRQTRIKNKQFLQKKYGLEQIDDLPLLVIVSRFDRQKGIDLVFESLKQLEWKPWQAIFLGSGDPILERSSQELAKAMPGRVHVENRYDSALSHQLYAGGDILLMPSRYEPCGLAQMIGMRYGCIPLARATGGLKDSIISYDIDPLAATGFLFKDATSEALSLALKDALDIYVQKDTWLQIQENGMKADFSWDKSAMQYINLYERLEKGL